MSRDLSALLADPDIALGTWSQIPAPELIDLIGLNGFAFTIIDCQHGPFGIETAENLARAAAANGVAAAIRVSRNDPVEIMKALDAGVPHVVVPNVETGAEAEAIVRAARFAPDGLRGACPCVRSGGHFVRDWPAYAAAEEARTGAIALVETIAGLREIEAIASTPGLTALMIGPFDLSVDMGCAGDWRGAEVQGALAEMVAAGRAAGLPVMMPVFAPSRAECQDIVARWREDGVNTFIVGSDKIMIANALHEWTGALSRPAAG